MAGVGDEIDTHAFDSARLAQIMQRQDQCGFEFIAAERRDTDLEETLDRDLFGPDHPLGALRRAHPVDGIEDVRRAQTARQRSIGLQTG